MIKRNIFLILLINLFSCSDQNITDQQLNEDLNYKSYNEIVIPGEYCANSCIWSKLAVSSGAQDAQMQCENSYCACVKKGNIWQSCQVDNITQDNISANNQSYSYNEYKGRLLADKAYSIAYYRNTTGRCYAAVADAIDTTIAIFLYGMHAYEAADQLANSTYFYEIYNYNLTTLPKGAVVVWAKGTSTSGHISVSLGNGLEASDHIAQQMINHYGGGKSRVFLPR